MPTKKLALYLAVLLGAAVFYYAYYGWFAGFLLWLLILLPAVSLLISLWGMRRAVLTLSAPDKVEEKAAAAVTVTLRAGLTVGRAEALLTLRNLFTGQSAERIRLRQLKESQSLPLDTGRCGCVRAVISKLYVCDLLGLFRLPLKQPDPVTVTVLPRPTTRQPLPDIPVLAAQLQPLAPKPGGGFAEDHEHREYRAGDPLRSIHWKLTAKMGTPIVREAMVPRGRGLSVTVDPQPDAGEAMAVLRRVTGELLAADIPFLLCWQREGAEYELPVSDRQDADGALFALLSAPADTLGPTRSQPRCMQITHEGVQAL